MSLELIYEKMRQPTKKTLRLSDSLEFYKQNGLNLCSAPEIQIKEQLVLSEDEVIFVDEKESEDLDTFELNGRMNSLKTFDDEEEDEDYLSEESDDDSDTEDEVEFSCPPWDDSDIEFTDDIEEETKDIHIETPFWFGAEDPDQIKSILCSYKSQLKLDEGRRRIREPEPFIGRVKRSVVKDNEHFMTFDEVEIFRRKILPPCSSIPPDRLVTVLTTWCAEEGVPKQFQVLSKCFEIQEWRNKASVKEQSYLLCLPNYGFDDFHYVVTEEKRDVTNSPRSKTIQLHFHYDKCIAKLPKSCQTVQCIGED